MSRLIAMGPGIRTPPTRKELLLGGGHLAALWTLAFVQPLLDLLGRNPDFFVARGNDTGDILILALGFTLIPPLLLLAVEAALARLSVPGYRLLHPVLLAGISAVLFARLIAKALPDPTALILLGALGLGVLLALGARRPGFLRNLLDLLIVAPAVILALFVFASPASRLILPGESEATAKTGSAGNGRPVVLMIFDELGTSDLMTRPGAIDRRRFPGLARFAGQSTWYINQSTTDFFTPRAVPAILTGRDPPDDALPTWRDQPENVFTLLGGDRPVRAMEPVTSLCPVRLCPADGSEASRSARLKALLLDLRYVEGRLLLPPEIADRLPDVSSTFQDFGLSGRSRSAPRANRFFVKRLGQGPDPGGYREFIEKIPPRRSSLTVMHLVLPHQPWHLTGTGRTYNRSPLDTLWNPEDDLWRVGEGGLAYAESRMYAQTAFADTLVGRLERTLRARGLWDRAIVVIAADHGISFAGGEVPRRRVDRRAMGEVANPPLLIKYPGQTRGRIDRRHSTTLDILPTIARAAGLETGQRFEGHPLQGPLPKRPVIVRDVLDGDREISVGLPEMIAGRNAAIERARRRLGGGPIRSLGPAPKLIGRKVLPVSAGSGAARLDHPEIWDEVDLAGDPVPVNVTGELADAAPGTIVAVAVNGRIRGTAASFGFDGAMRFGALIDPASLTGGANRIDLFTLERGRLVPAGGNRP